VSRAWTLALLAAVAGCSPSAEAKSPEILEIERLAFVPTGQCVFWPGFGTRVVCANARPLLVDRFEVTRADWRAWCERASPPQDPAFTAWLAAWGPETSDWPATFMTLAEARAFAAWRGMRLPTAREWMRLACGTDERPYDYPWGGTRRVSVANTLELELGNPLPVGTFEQGRTSLSVYDMAGNVWEWVEDPIATPSSEAPPGLAWAMGGSYLSNLRRLYDTRKGLAFLEEDLDPAARSNDVGLRCCADAAQFLWSHAGGWSAERAREKLLAVGAAWGRDAVPLLEELASRPGAPPSLPVLLDGARR
jgi:hypothetical protein